MGGFVGYRAPVAPSNIGNNVPAPNVSGEGCCNECYSSSIGNSGLFSNPIVIGSAALQIANGNPSRKELFLINTSTDIIYIGLGYAPSFNGNGGSYSFALAPCLSAKDDGTGGIFVSDMWQGPIFAVSATGNGLLCFTEEV